MEDIEKKFKEDKEKYISSPVFNDEDDDFLGNRGKGCYIKEIHDNKKYYNRVIFDNGHCYFLEDETGKVVEYHALSFDIFFHKIIENVSLNYIKNTDISKYITPSSYAALNVVNIGFTHIKDKSSGMFAHYNIDTDNRILYLTNIFLPYECSHQGLGITYLSQIYKVCQEFSYQMQLNNCVQSFYDRMVKRGAKVIFKGNDLEITDTTDLSIHKH